MSSNSIKQQCVQRRLLIVSDAWHPQVNGVVRSLTKMAELAPQFGFEAHVIGPDSFRTLPCPSYPEIRLVMAGRRTIEGNLEAARPDLVHIATEGPLGWRARRWCLANGKRFTTSYHTKFPDYLAARLPVRPAWVYPFLKKFHAPAASCLVPTPSVQQELEAQGFINIKLWSRGVDADQFHPETPLLEDLPATGKPRALYVGRIAIEKNLDAFLSLDADLNKIVVGDGPDLPRLRKAYPDATFLGKREGAALAGIYAACDVFVFPSKTDTFGIVLLEALASGLPIAAYPVSGPIDVLAPENGRAGIATSQVGVLDNDLGRAVEHALLLNPADCRQFGAAHSWMAVAEQFYGSVYDANKETLRAA